MNWWRGCDRIFLSIFDETVSKTVHEENDGHWQRREKKRHLIKYCQSKTLIRITAVFAEKNCIKYEVPVSIKLLDPGYESKNPYKLKENSFSWVNC